MMTLQDYQVQQAMPLLEALGFRFSYDLDDSTLIESPTAIDVAQITTLLRDHPEAVRRFLHFRREDLKKQYFGGPLHGLPHRESHYCARSMIKKLGPARWASYTLDDEDRALFAGETTSEKKARALAYGYHDELVKAGRIKPLGLSTDH